MRDLSLHILDIVQNSLRAGASLIQLRVEEDQIGERLTIEIRDNGRGMTEEEIVLALDPFYTTRTTRKVGLGLSMFQANCQACGGGLYLNSQPGSGTCVTAIMGLTHLDRPPLGDLPASIAVLIAGSPQVDFVLQRKKGEKEYFFSTGELREVLGDIPLCQPQVIDWIRDYLNEQEIGLSG